MTMPPLAVPSSLDRAMEVTPEEKNQVSHRAVALRAFYDKLKEEGYADK